MEPHAIVAAWDGDKLSIDTPSQGLAMARGRIAGLFGHPAGKRPYPQPIPRRRFWLEGPVLRAAGSRHPGGALGRAAGQARAATRPDVRPGGPSPADASEASHRRRRRRPLTALDHHVKTVTSTFDDFFEPAAEVSHTLYASPAIAATHEAARIDIGTPLFMRAPGEASGSIALESAIDEAAWACGMDPLDFRLKNYAEVEPISGKPFSSKALRECYAEGAERFGWSRRALAPRQMRDDDGLLIGWGVGTATFPAIMFQAEARAVLRGDGSGSWRSGARHGPGRLDRARTDRGRKPRARHRSGRVQGRHAPTFLMRGIAGGSAHTATAGTAIHDAGADAIARLADLATNDERSPLFGAGNAGVFARDGRLFRRDDESRSESYADILARAGLAEIEGRGKSAADPARATAHAMHAHGAVFAEVKVDPDLGQIRVTRLVGAFAAGRIINPHLVRSQYYGGMIWGVSFALHEHAIMDPRSGRVDERRSGRVPRSGERRRAVARGYPGRGA